MIDERRIVGKKFNIGQLDQAGAERALAAAHREQYQSRAIADADTQRMYAMQTARIERFSALRKQKQVGDFVGEAAIAGVDPKAARARVVDGESAAGVVQVTDRTVPIDNVARRVNHRL